MRDPCSGVPMLLAGTLPTITTPFRRAFSAVVKPNGAVPRKKVLCSPPGVTLTIVVPVPWPDGEAALKFDTRISPDAVFPPLGNPFGTNATPYGFTSPLVATVLVWTGINGSTLLPASAGCADISPTATNTRPAPTNCFRFLIDTWSPDTTAVTIPPKSLADSPLRRRQLISSRILSFWRLIRTWPQKAGAYLPQLSGNAPTMVVVAKRQSDDKAAYFGPLSRPT